MKIGSRISSSRDPDLGIGTVVGYQDSSLGTGTLLAVRFDDCTEYIDDVGQPDCHYIQYKDAVSEESPEEDTGWGVVLGGAAAALLGASLLKKVSKSKEEYLPKDKTETKEV